MCIENRYRSRPNIIVIVTHDTGRHFGCYGVASVNTPAIDALDEALLDYRQYQAGG